MYEVLEAPASIREQDEALEQVLSDCIFEAAKRVGNEGMFAFFAGYRTWSMAESAAD